MLRSIAQVDTPLTRTLDLQSRSMQPQTRLLNASVDDLLKQQEGPVRKKRRLSEAESQVSTASHSNRDEQTIQLLQGDRTLSDSESESISYNISEDVHLRPRVVLEGRSRSASGIPKNSELLPSQSSISERSSFASLGVSNLLVNALKGMSIKAPTDVQASCIPQLLAGRYISLFISSPISVLLRR